MEAERENIFQQLITAQDLAEQRATDLRNLQLVLEQFQRDQSTELSVALKRSQLELSDALRECEKLRTEQRLTQVVYVCLCVGMRVCVCVYGDCVHVCMHVGVYVRVCVWYLYVCMYMYSSTH